MTAARQMTLFSIAKTAPGVGLEVRSLADFEAREKELINMARLSDRTPIEAWRVTGTNRQLAYSTHGIFRFFGKFPPPIARYLIEKFTAEGDWVLDPMMGSATTAVEALDLRRNIVARDISPLSTLLCRVKTRHVPEVEARRAFARVQRRFDNKPACELPLPVGLRNAEHWFLPKTMESLGRLRLAIEPERDIAIRELLLATFASTVRRVSKATTQQGRLFLDVKKAKPDAWPTFSDRFDKYSSAVASLPVSSPCAQLLVEQVDAKSRPASPRPFRLAIVHPPYFNNYKYSSIFSLELAWLWFARMGIRDDEIREGFKLGKPEKVVDYVDDLAVAVASIASQVDAGGALALMMGDTIIRESYIDVTRQLLRAIEATDANLSLDRVVLRVPQYTEASWVASQRRTGDKVGVTLNDFILLFSKVEPPT